MDRETLVIMPYSSRIDRHGKTRMSSHTALNTAGAIKYLNLYPNVDAYIPGESTFGPDYPSTGELVKAELMAKGIDERRITFDSGLNDTESQLAAVRDQIEGQVAIMALDFHTERIGEHVRQDNQRIPILAAEGILLRRDLDPEKMEKLVRGKQTMLGISKVYLFEGLAKRAVKLGKPGKLALGLVRTALGKDGPTVTDYHDVDSAKAHLRKAKAAGYIS